MVTQTQSKEQLQAISSPSILVTADNFIRAESDMYFSEFVKRGALGKFFHYRELPSVELKSVRANRDTFYSEAVIDLDAGPATINLPDAAKRFMSMLVINEDHYAIAVNYGKGDYSFTREQAGTRYLFVAIRTFVNPNDSQDVEQVHTLQNQIKISQPGGPGKFEVPNWDPISQKKVRDLLKGLGETIPDMNRAFGTKEEVDPVRRLIGAAAAWGGNPDKDAIYLNFTPAKNDGVSSFQLRVPANVPVDGFWSVTVYTSDGFFQKNDLNAYSLNSITSKKEADGSVIIQFGDCGGKIANCLPITAGWNYMVRLYRPRPEILNSKWKFPDAEPVSQ